VYKLKVTEDGVSFEAPTIQGLDQLLSNNFHRIREVRARGVKPHAYLLPDPIDAVIESTDEGEVVVLTFPNLHLTLIGDPAAEGIHESLARNHEDAMAFRSVYNQEAIAHAATGSKRKFPAFLDWFEERWDTFRSYGYHFIEEEPVRFSNELYEYCLAYADLRKIKEGPYPAWQNFIDQIDPPEGRDVFCAWVYANINAKNHGKQGMHAYDPRGGAGKTTVWRVVDACVPGIQGTISNDTFCNQFKYARIFGKPSLVYYDCKKIGFWKAEEPHSITGGDRVSVERKGQEPFDYYIKAHLTVCSNNMTLLDLYNPHEKNRVIPITFDSSLCKDPRRFIDGVQVTNNKWQGELIEQFWCFMYHARECYDRLCINDGDILVPEILYENTQSDLGDLFSEIFEEYFEYVKDDPKGEQHYIPAKNMRDKFTTVVDMSRYAKIGLPLVLSEWTKFLRSRGMPCMPVDRGVKPHRYKGKAYMNIDFKTLKTFKANPKVVADTAPTTSTTPTIVPPSGEEIDFDDFIIEEGVVK